MGPMVQDDKCTMGKDKQSRMRKILLALWLSIGFGLAVATGACGSTGDALPNSDPSPVTSLPAVSLPKVPAGVAGSVGPLTCTHSDGTVYVFPKNGTMAGIPKDVTCLVPN
jgi:hypothetical protein